MRLRFFLSDSHAGTDLPPDTVYTYVHIQLQLLNLRKLANLQVGRTSDARMQGMVHCWPNSKRARLPLRQLNL